MLEKEIIFRADLNAYIVLTILSSTFLIVAICAFIQNGPNDRLLAIFPLILWIYFITFPARHKIIVNRDGIFYKSFIKYHFIKWEDISKFKNDFSVDKTKPTVSLSIYKYRQKEPVIMINIKMFSKDTYLFMTQILDEHIKKNKEARKLKVRTK